MQPYTYLIGWSKLDIWYYGARYAKGCHPSDLWNPYLTSSPTVKRFIDANGNPDVIQIRKTFKTAVECRAWESKVLDRINAARHPKMLNRRNGSWKWATYIITDNHRSKISNSLKGKIKSKEHIQKIHASRKGFRWTNEQKIQMSKQRKGKSRPESFGEKISNLIWITNGESHKRIQNSDPIPEGWIIGRQTPWRKSTIIYTVTSPEGVIQKMTREDFVTLMATKSPNVPSPKPGFSATYRGWILQRCQENT